MTGLENRENPVMCNFPGREGSFYLERLEKYNEY